MVALSLALAVATVTASPDVVLLQFTAPWCGPCRQMEPVTKAMTQAGYPIRKIDIDQHRQLAQQFRVTSIPCFVLVQNDREVRRLVGSASQRELMQLFDSAGVGPNSLAANAPSANVRGQSPDGPLNRIAPNSAAHGRWNGANPPAGGLMPPTQRGSGADDPFRHAQANASAGEQCQAQPGPIDLLKYCARLKIEDRDGSSYGTGTIIDIRGDQALILTCGHIFRESQGNGTVLVDLFVPGAAKKIPGKIVSYDLTRDVGLVSIRPGVQLEAAPVAPPGFEFNEGDRLLTVGCNNGSDPTVEHTHVLAINKFVGPPNVQVAGQPVQGRSGGGLFLPDGTVVGVCNAADPTDNAGLFAAAATIHAELDAAKLSSIYRSRLANPAAFASMNSPSANHDHAVRPAFASEPVSPTAAELARAATGADSRISLASLSEQAPDAEVICIVCPRGNPQAKSEVIVLDRASASFMQQLASERQTQQARRLTSHETRTPARDEWRGASE